MQHKILINTCYILTIIDRILTDNINGNENSLTNHMNMNMNINGKCNNDELIYTKDPKSCECYYVSCDSGQNKQIKFKQKFKCTESFYWDQKILTCVPHNYHCDENLNNNEILEHKNGETFSSPKKYSPSIKTRIINTDICDNGGVYHPDPNDCHYFIQCSNGVPYRFQCAEPLFWNQKILSCIWDSTHCMVETNEIIGPKSTETLSSSSKYSPSTRKMIIDPKVCDNGGVYYPDLNNCRYFIQCSNGVPYRFQCAEPLFWNQEILSCVWDSKHCMEQSFSTTKLAPTKITNSSGSNLTFTVKTLPSSEGQTIELTTLMDKDGLTQVTTVAYTVSKISDMPANTSPTSIPDISSSDQTTITPVSISTEEVTSEEEISTKSITSFVDTTVSAPKTITFESTSQNEITETATKSDMSTMFITFTDETTVTSEFFSSSKTVDLTELTIDKEITMYSMYTTDHTDHTDHTPTSVEATSTEIVTYKDIPTVFTTSVTDATSSDLRTITSETTSSGERTEQKEITKSEEISTQPMTSATDYSLSDQTDTSIGTTTSDFFSEPTETFNDTEISSISTDSSSFDQTIVTFETTSSEDTTTESVPITTKDETFTISTKSIIGASSSDHTSTTFENTSSDATTERINVDTNGDKSTVSVLSTIDSSSPDRTTITSEAVITTETMLDQTKITDKSSPSEKPRITSPNESTIMPTTMLSIKSSTKIDVATTLTTTSSNVILDPKICENGQMYHSDQYDKQYFVQCTNGIPQRFKCAEPYTWNQEALSCVWIEQKCFTQIHTLPNPFSGIESPTTSIVPTELTVKCYFDDTYIPDPTNCHEFYHCINGTPFKKICSSNQFWDPQLLTCTWSNQNCYINSEAERNPTIITSLTDLPKTTAITPSLREPFIKTTAMAPALRSPFIKTDQSKLAISYNKKVKCNSGDTYLPDPTHCHVFYHCSNGVPFKKICPSNLFWDPQLLTCTWSDQNCYIDSEAEINSKTITSAPTILETTAMTPPLRMPFIKTGQNKLKTSYNKKVKCNPGDTYLPDPHNCNAFYHCSNGVPFKKHCPSQLFWDQTLLICNWSNDNC